MDLEMVTGEIFLLYAVQLIHAETTHITRENFL